MCLLEVHKRFSTCMHTFSDTISMIFTVLITSRPVVIIGLPCWLTTGKAGQILPESRLQQQCIFRLFCKYSGLFSYLPIIVECCWTAASRSLSSMVHSPMFVHPETRAHGTLHEFPGNVIISCVCVGFFSYSPEVRILSGKCIDHTRHLLPAL